MWSMVFIRGVIFSLSLFSAAGYAQTEVKFTSLDVFDIDGRTGPAKTLTVPGLLKLPEGQGPFPAIVISNSSAGTGDRISAALLQDLPKYGFAAFAIQSFTARQLTGGVDARQTAVSFQGPAADALYALQYLRSRPEIDSNRICVIGHSRGGATSFNFSYFKSFIELSGFKGAPFDCNVSINHSGFVRPENEETTGKPALVFIGDRDNVWHMDVNAAWYESLIKRGEDIKFVVIPNSYHSLSSVREWCPRFNTPRKCRSAVLYGKDGAKYEGKPIGAVEYLRQCNEWGYYCGYGTMDRYPYVLNIVIQFFNEHIGVAGKAAQTKVR